ncbi:MAG: UvrD-helicase domain-containing protein, partial [Burkholderiales bacterium]|nr:UvrD-helicase domain-containing protein [Burkholderiales bacterium]
MTRELDVFSVPLAGVQLVEASAGTGKTWTLCALVLRLLLERGLRLPEILLVTFTTAATAELRERVRLRLVEAIAHLNGAPEGRDPLVPELLRRLQAAGAAPQQLAERLNEALLGFDEAAIHTIHGFAQRSLAELAFAAGQRSEWEAVQDESDLRLEVAQAWWREQLVPPGAQAPLLLDFLRAGGDTPERFADQLGEHLRLPLARCIWPPDADLSPRDADEADALLQEARALFAAERDSLRGLVEADLARWPSNIYKPEAVATAFEEWEALIAAPDALLRPLKLDKTKLKLLRRSHLDEKLKKHQAPLPAHPFPLLADALIDAIEALQQQLDAARRALRARWLQQGRERLLHLKAERGLLGYDDMLQRLHAQLQQPAALAQLRQRYPAALIDEFQDTDPLQYALFKRLQPPCCFFVGDPKQAIYRFRQADLPTYLQARAEADAVWTLTHNQRSTPELLEALNALFGRRPDAFLQPGLHYLPVQAGSKRKAVLTERTPSSALQLWSWTPQPAQAARQRVLSHLAADIARRLHPLAGDRLGDGVDDAPLQPRHIAVLVRTHRQAGWVVDALRAVGVEAVALAQGSVWASPEAQELLQLLEALLGPPREDRQRALLASVALGLDAAALAQLSEGEAWQQQWAGRWRRWRELAQERLRERAPAAFLHAWLEDSGAAQRLLALPQGERRLSNWLHAIELLQQEAGHSASPSALLAWLRRQRHERGGGEDALLRLESDAARVQVITVHRSKGLEFPIVYLPFAHEGESRRGGDKPWALRCRDDAQQQVLDYAASELSPAQKAMQALEDAAEAVRLHYVGLTRAALRCVVSVGLLSSSPGQPASRFAPLHALVAHDGQVPWPEHELKNDAIEAAWAEQGQAPHTALRQLDGEAIPEPLLRAEAAPQLAARTPPSPLPALHWVGSFSRLIQPGHGASLASGSEPDATMDAALAPDD